ncbi:hypothetical protein BJ912DRAFT_240367 [Pholiota molesta]|nr:hypothetical protein BJ912DRAFT_240367 [Pholiota molesta]
MMFYHDGLRIHAAETARHSSILRAPPSDPFLHCHRFDAQILITHLQVYPLRDSSLSCNIVILGQCCSFLFDDSLVSPVLR